jgi:hypothetical protein
VWMHKVDDHWEYIATYVDDILSFSEDPMAVIKSLEASYVLKGVGEPEYYLGGDIAITPEAKVALTAKTYILRAVEKFEKIFEQEAFRTYQTPMEEQYHPKLDESEFLTPAECSLYRGLIGSANWMITLGRFDIHYAVNTLSRFSMEPRTTHLQAMLSVFGYLKKFPDGQITVDPTHTTRTTLPLETATHNWQNFYRGMIEALPPGMPEPLGASPNTMAYVDADHAHDQLTRRSVTGILLLMNGMPIRWYSKRQLTVETSSYSSELVAARIATDDIIELRYKLRMLGVPVNDPIIMLGDNKAVLQNTTVPSSMLKKKYNAIAYHRVQESIAGGILRSFHIPSTKNLADILTRPLSRQLFHQITNAILFSHHPHTTHIPITFASTSASILGMCTSYDSDHGLEMYDSDFDEDHAISATSTAHSQLNHDSDVEIETVISHYL